MIKILKAIRGILYYALFQIRYKNYELLVIETNIFGHAILESALVRKYVRNFRTRKVLLVVHPHSANEFLTQSIISTVLHMGVKQSHLGKHALHGQNILKNRLSLRSRIKTVQFQEELTHYTASSLEPEFLPTFDFDETLSNGYDSSVKTLLLMNRSAAYKKFKESDKLHAYRDFDFSVIDSASKYKSAGIQLVRIGAPDGLETINREIDDKREEIQTKPVLDIHVQVSADAYFGADSGPAWLAFSLKKPVAFINMIPLNQQSPINSKSLVVIPKLLYSKSDQRILTLSEMISPTISSLRSSVDYENIGLVPLDNSQSDVNELFIDWQSMLLEGVEIVDEEFMLEARKRFNCPKLPSIHSKFIHNHPEVFLK